MNGGRSADECPRSGNHGKALHHTISSAALLLNWHRRILDGGLPTADYKVLGGNHSGTGRSPPKRASSTTTRTGAPRRQARLPSPPCDRRNLEALESGPADTQFATSLPAQAEAEPQRNIEAAEPARGANPGRRKLAAQTPGGAKRYSRPMRLPKNQAFSDPVPP